MSHNVETMAYTNEVPWHGLGVYVEKAPTIKKMIELAKLDWKVERRTMMVDGRKVEGFDALVRSSDKQVLDVVGSMYVPTQNHEAFEFFKEYVEAGDATMETAGSLRNGRYVWGLAKLNKNFKLPGNDVVKGYLLVCCPHQQGKALMMKTTAVRVVCNNTLTAAIEEGGTEFRMSHRREFNASMIKQAKETLGLAREQIDRFEEMAIKLKKMKMGEQDVVDVLAKVYQPDEDVKVASVDEKASRTLKRLLDVYKNAPGADVGNGWGVLNAVTYYSDHVASRTADKRLTNAWFGRTGRDKQKVLDLLLA